MELDIDKELAEVKEYEVKLAKLNELRRKVGTEGISREIGLGLEDLCGGPIQGIDIRKLTTNPSRASQVAVEAIDLKRIGLMIFGSMALLSLLIKIFNWLFANSKGSPGGGGGGGKSNDTRKLEEALEKKIEEAEAYMAKLKADPDAEVLRRRLTDGSYTNAPQAVEVIIKTAISTGKYNVDQIDRMLMRVLLWCKMFKFVGVEECKDHPGFIAMMHLASNYGSSIDMSLIGFMDDIPCLTQDVMVNYTGRLGPQKRLAQLKQHYTATRMARYINPKSMDDANMLAEMIKETVDGIENMLDIYEDKMEGRLTGDAGEEKYQAAILRMRKELFSKESKYYRVGRAHSNVNGLVDLHNFNADWRQTEIDARQLEMAGVPVEDIHVEPMPYTPISPTIHASIWREIFAILDHSKVTLTVPLPINAHKEKFPFMLDNFQLLYKVAFDSMDRVNNAISAANSREMASFHKDIGKISKELERDASKLRDRVKMMRGRAGEIIYHMPPGTKEGDLLIPMEKFLAGAADTGKFLVQFCKDVERARAAADTWKFKI